MPSGGPSGASRRLHNPLSLPGKKVSGPETCSVNGRLTAGQTFRPELRRSFEDKGKEVFIWETQALLIDHGSLEY